MAKGKSVVLSDRVVLPLTVLAFLVELVDNQAIDRLVVFGSWAVGDQDPTSDIDLAVFAPSLSRQEFAGLRVAADDARSLYWIGLVHFEQTPAPLQQRIMQQGVTIYERA